MALSLTLSGPGLTGLLEHTKLLLASGPLLLPSHLLATYCLPPVVQTYFLKETEPDPRRVSVSPHGIQHDDWACIPKSRCWALSTGGRWPHCVHILLATVHSPPQRLGLGGPSRQSSGTSVGTHRHASLCSLPALCKTVECALPFCLNPRGSTCLPGARKWSFLQRRPVTTHVGCTCSRPSSGL